MPDAAKIFGQGDGSKRRDENRPNAHQRGYDRTWQRVSKAFLRSHPMCSACEAKGFEAFREFKNADLLSRKRLPPDLPVILNAQRSVALEAPTTQGISLYNRSLKLNGQGLAGGVAVLTMVISGSLLSENDANILIVVDLLQDFLIRKLQTSELAEVFLIFKIFMIFMITCVKILLEITEIILRLFTMSQNFIDKSLHFVKI